jgi:hypothetical protein
LSTIISIWCRGEASVAPRELGSLVEEGAYFEAPEFEPGLDSDAGSDPQWDLMTIRYEQKLRPIVIRASEIDATSAAEIIEEIGETFGRHRLDSTSIRNHIESSRRIIEIDIDPSSLTDDAWEACDVIEHYLAARLSGLIYVPDEGVYDSSLQPILTWKREPTT